MLAADYPFLEVLWTLLVFFAWVIWFWLLITVFADVFRRHDIGGGAKTLWIIFVIILPFLGVFIYLLTQNDGMTQRNAERAGAQQAQFDQYVRATARSGGAAAEIEKAKGLLDSGCDHAGRVRRHQAEGARVVLREERGMEEIGPVDYVIVAFPGNRFRGEIAPAIAELVENGTIRVIDIAFVVKDEDGNAVAMELLELDPEVQQALDSIGVEVGGLLSDDDLMDAADGLEPNSSAAMIVWENVWARKVAQAMRDAGGQLVAFERLPHDVVQAAREWALEQAKA